MGGMRLASGSIDKERSDMGSPWGLQQQPARRGAENRRNPTRCENGRFRLTAGLIFGKLTIVETVKLPTHQSNMQPALCGGFCYSGACVLQTVDESTRANHPRRGIECRNP